MAHTVTVRQTDETFTVEDGAYVLEAALAQGISFPRYCRSGVCGACKVTLVRGELEMGSFSTAALNDEERALQRVLGCRAVLKSDVEIAYIPRDVVPRIVHKVATHAGRVTAVEPATDDVKILRVALADGERLVFTAGQYVDIAFAGLPARAFSVANRPGEADLEFHIRTLADGEVGEYLATRVSVGDPVEVAGPHGPAYLREYHGGSVVAVAGGTGLAPIKSIVDMALTAGMRQDIHLFIGARRERDLYLESHFRSLAERHPNLRVTTVLSEPDGPTERPTGFVSDVLAAEWTPGDGCRAYLFGPPPMVEASLAVVQRAGVRRRFCFSDHFEKPRGPAE